MTEKSLSSQHTLRRDIGLLFLLALASLGLHLVTNGQYGFHRDELDTLDNARRLAWGYVAYPPVTPFIARIGLELFGPSLLWLRFLASLAQAVAIVLTGLMARDMGGGRLAQGVAAVAVTIAPVAMTAGLMLHYLSFDYLWWVLVAFGVVRLCKSDNPRWWLLIGAAIGLGMMTKYTMIFYVAGVVVGVLGTARRRDLRSPWLWSGVALALLIFLPNVLWQIHHEFISLTFLSSIHARDIAWGRTEEYLLDQLYATTNPFTLPLWLAGLYFVFWAAAGQRFRLLGWLFVTPFLLLWLLQGRGYYLAPAYPMLLAAGAVWGERWLQTLAPQPAQRLRNTVKIGLTVGAVITALLTLPLTPVNSPVWQVADGIHENFREMVGWPELVATVADIYAKLPAEERTHTAILTGNYGEMGAINLYGPAYGLPEAISGINSAWERGYGDPPPQTVIIVGYGEEAAHRLFQDCQVVGQVTNRYGIANEESSWRPTIMLCQAPRQPWPTLWPHLRSFG